MEHSASRHADVLAADAPHLLAPTPTPTQRHRALEEIVSTATETLGVWPASDSPDVRDALARIVELARLLHRLEPMDERRWTIDGDPARANEQRAHAGLMALAAFPLGGGFDLTIADDLEALIGDVVCALMHLADRGGIDPLRAVDRGEGHYREEAADALEAEHTVPTTDRRSTT